MNLSDDGSTDDDYKQKEDTIPAWGIAWIVIVVVALAVLVIVLLNLMWKQKNKTFAGDQEEHLPQPPLVVLAEAVQSGADVFINV